jgi:hypothetical protein
VNSGEVSEWKPTACPSPHCNPVCRCGFLGEQVSKSFNNGYCDGEYDGSTGGTYDNSAADQADYAEDYEAGYSEGWKAGWNNRKP